MLKREGRGKTGLFHIPQKSVLVDWCISYFLILLIPLVIGIVNNLSSYQMLRSEMEEAQTIVLESFQKEVDSTLENLEYVGGVLMNDERLTTAASMGDVLLASYRCRGLFRSHKVSNPKLSLLLYVTGTQLMISDDTANYLNMVYASLPEATRSNLDQSQWQQEIEASPLTRFRVSRNLSHTNLGTDSLVFETSIGITGNQYNRANLFVSLPCNSLSSLSPNVHYMIVGSDGAKLWGWQTEEISRIEELAGRSDRQGTFFFRSGEVSYLCCYRKSSRCDWYYLSLTPADVLHQQSRKFYSGLMYMTLLALILGLLLTSWFVKRHYVTLSQMIRAVNATENGIKGNEFERVKDAFSRLTSENDTIRKKLGTQQERIRENYLLSLLNGRADRLPDSEAAEKVHLTLSGKSLQIAAMRFEQENAEDREDRMTFDILSYAVNNVLEELLGGKAGCSRTFDGDLIIYLFALEREQWESQSQEILKALRELHEFFESRFAVTLTIMVGDQVDHYENLYDGYGHILNLSEYLRESGSHGIFFTSELREAGEPLQYRETFQRSLCAAIEQGDADAGVSAAQELFKEISGYTSLPGETGRHLYYSVLEILMEAFQRAVPDDQPEIKRMLKMIASLENLKNKEELSREILSLVRHTCTYVALHSGKQSSTIALRAMEYVDQNYADPNLNVSAVAQALGISGKTVSHHFRSSTSMGLLDYINYVRISHAIEIAGREMVSIEHLSEMVGYTSVKTFRRAFAKVEGVTPGKFLRKQQESTEGNVPHEE